MVTKSKKQTKADSTKKPAKKSYSSRKFLNKDKGLAAIETTFVFDPTWIYGYGWEATVTLSDCNRNVNLNFSVYDVKDIDKQISKISMLLTELEKLGNLMLEYREAAAESIKKADEERKQRIKERKQPRTLDEVVEELNAKGT